MKKHSSIPLFKITTFSLLLTAFSCQKSEFDNELIVSEARANGGGANTVPVVNLQVDVDESNPNAGIKDDNLGSYVHGDRGVAAYFDQYGNLIFDTYTGMSRKSTVPAPRGLVFTFSPTEVYSSKDGSYRIVTQINGLTPLQNLGVDAVQKVSMGGGFRKPTESTAEFNFSFRYNAENNSGSPTNYAEVRRTSLNTWEIAGEVPEPVCSLTKKGVNSGYRSLPFKLKLTRKL